MKELTPFRQWAILILVILMSSCDIHTKVEEELINEYPVPLIIIAKSTPTKHNEGSVTYRDGKGMIHYLRGNRYLGQSILESMKVGDTIRH